MSKIWVIIANSTSCRIYDYNRKAKTLSLIKILQHPESKFKNQDLVSDKPGHYQTSHAARSAYEPHKEPHEVEIEHFVHDVVQELKIGKNFRHYEQLILLLPPKMSGLVQAAMDKAVYDSILKNIVKDYTHLDEKAIIKVLEDSFKLV